MMYQLSALCLLLTAAAAAELYDELPDAENEQEDNNNIENGPLKPRAEDIEASRLQDLLLYQLIKEHIRQEVQEAKRRPRKDQDQFEEMENSLMKREVTERNNQPQTKKGRGVGNQMCYFKLCSFRNPV